MLEYNACNFEIWLAAIRFAARARSRRRVLPDSHSDDYLPELGSENYVNRLRPNREVM